MKDNIDKPKKVQYSKKYSLSFPFKTDIKIIQNNSIILFLSEKLKQIKEFSNSDKSSLKYGLNSSLKQIQNTNDNIEKMIFIFYQESIFY